MIRALFFDIDGTLVSFETHSIPHSTVQALQIAKAKGIRIFISTGRPYALINNLDAIKHLIDGYITANGAYCFVGEKSVSCTPIPANEVEWIINQADAQNFACIVVGQKDYTTIHPSSESERIFKGLLNVPDLRSHVPLSLVLSQPILQLTPFISTSQEVQFVSSLQHVESSRWHPDFADFTAKGVNKAKGLREMAASQHIDISETMAFGDGGNDVPILQAAGIGVAMGNASIDVKKAADYTTSSVDDDGIYNALKYWSII